MKKSTNVLTYSLLALMAWSLTMIGCGDKKDGSDAAETAEASSEAAGNITDKFKEGMINMAKEMTGIVEDVESVEDAEKAEPKIEAMMGKLAGIFTELGDNFESLSMKDAMELQNMQSVMQDPEVMEWGKKVEAATAKLKEEHPDAAAKLEEITQKHGQKFMEAMMNVAMKIQQKVGAANGMGVPHGADTDTDADTAAGH